VIFCNPWGFSSLQRAWVHSDGYFWRPTVTPTLKVACHGVGSRPWFETRLILDVISIKCTQFANQRIPSSCNPIPLHTQELGKRILPGRENRRRGGHFWCRCQAVSCENVVKRWRAWKPGGRSVRLAPHEFQGQRTGRSKQSGRGNSKASCNHSSQRIGVGRGLLITAFMFWKELYEE